MKRYLLLLGALAALQTGGFIWMVTYCFGFSPVTVCALLMPGVMFWCITEISIINYKHEVEMAERKDGCTK